MIVRTEAELDKVLNKIASSDRWSLDTEGLVHIYPDWILVGISLSTDGKDGYYIPVGHDGNSQLEAEFVVNKLKPYLEDSSKLIYMHNAKYDIEALRIVDPSLTFKQEGIFCTMTASFILDTNNQHGLKACAEREFGTNMIVMDQFVPKQKCKITGDKLFLTHQTEIEDMAKYAIADAVQTYRLGELYKKRINKEGYDKVFYELEMPFIFVLVELEEQGVKIDTDRLAEFMEEAPKKAEELYQKIVELLPEGQKELNVNSPKQLNELFFKHLKIKPIGDKGKSGLYSVKADFLEAWASEHQVCKLIVEYRKLSKLATTYIANFSNRLSSDNRLRCNFNRHVAATGRLSSSKPNLQNVPVKRNDVYGLRSLFIAEEGKKLIVADYSQIELRLGAHLSKDPTMIQAFLGNQDLHSITAKAAFSLKEPVEEIADKYPTQRSIAKGVNFGIIYEAGPLTLANTVNKVIEDPEEKVSVDDMKEIMEAYFEKYPYVKRYIDKCHNYAERHGYVKTITGRKRFIPEAALTIDRSMSPHEQKAVYAQKFCGYRKASNLGAQGGAADLLAIAMRNIYNRVRRERLEESAKFILQVHDELAMEVDEDKVEQVSIIIKEEMENAVELKVPLVADLSVVDSWGDAK